MLVRWVVEDGAAYPSSPSRLLSLLFCLSHPPLLRSSFRNPSHLLQRLFRSYRVLKLRLLLTQLSSRLPPETRCSFFRTSPHLPVAECFLANNRVASCTGEPFQRSGERPGCAPVSLEKPALLCFLKRARIFVNFYYRSIRLLTLCFIEVARPNAFVLMASERTHQLFVAWEISGP